MAEESQELVPHIELNAQQKAIIEALRIGNTRTASAAAAGVARSTLYEWLDSNRTFSDAVKVAEASAELSHVGCVANAAAKGNWTASAWWLERRRPQNWREIKSIDVSKLPTETLIALLESEGEDREGTAEEGAAASSETIQEP